MSQMLALAAPAAVLCGWFLRSRFGIAAVCFAVAVVSIGATSGAWAAGRWAESERWTGLVGMLELASLLALVVLTLRAEGGRRGAVAVWTIGGAVALWPSRFQDASGAVGALTLFGFGSVLTLPPVLIGLYLRGLDEGRRRSVAAARRAQRLELAHDLHDFVAHDVSGMVAQAQAGTVLAAIDPVRAAALFERIEQAGLQALASLDRTVHLLRSEDGDEDGPERAPQPGLVELAELTERFTDSGDVVVRLDAPAEEPAVPREVAATAYRIVVEALTNVRRHAPAARVVDVRVRSEARRLTVRVRDDGGGASPSSGSRRGGGGSGLAGLAARVEALGGTLSAGREGNGWQVAVTMPLKVG
ncbi:ATP-binding protein [Streptomyces sp. XY431]|uniref:sensor histidine kinase n=1 Tax=Streptomyces sp. XY431 TaxID=1415562 RepID=UPI000B30A1A4|nr:ATP-binding protein [Streptomyces sp. XY431]